MKPIAVIALGSNLQQPHRQVSAALNDIAALPDTRLLKASSLYLSKPVGYADQPDFINAVCLVETGLPPLTLLRALQQIEQQYGRERSFRNAPRTLDLDIIDYNGQTGDSEELTLPHPRAHERSFVMLPLAEIAPDCRIGTHGTAAQLAAQLGGEGIELFNLQTERADGL